MIPLALHHWAIEHVPSQLLFGATGNFDLPVKGEATPNR